jgi:5-methylcytosine-specific restriction endonuclease McrBC GTP-binding regulatory subunit McrB
LEESRINSGTNILLYGVPGSGKSWTIEHEYCKVDSYVERLVFHPDYTYSDFVGQILPDVDDEGLVTYKFTPGPFTTIMREAYRNPTQEYILIIEEINRGNAPAIFGEVFQLLDRTLEPKKDHEVVYPAGTSEYGITNRYMATVIYGDGGHKVRIPSNLSVIGTMNTSDQNVFTLDTAFQRRWNMRLIENTFENVRPSLANAKILDTEVTWETFCTTINKLVIGNRAKMASAEDKRLGVYFVHESDLEFDDRAISPDNDLRGEYNVLLKAERDGNLTPEQKGRLYDIREALKKIRKFPEKVIKYLWDDAFKFNPEALFDTDNMESLEQVIRTFVYSTGRDRFKIFKPTVRSTFYPDSQA